MPCKPDVVNKEVPACKPDAPDVETPACRPEVAGKEVPVCMPDVVDTEVPACKCPPKVVGGPVGCTRAVSWSSIAGRLGLL